MSVEPSGLHVGNPTLNLPLSTSVGSDPSTFNILRLAGANPRPPKNTPNPKAIRWQSGDQVGTRAAPSWRWKIFLRSVPSGFMTLKDAVGLPKGKSRSVMASLPDLGQIVGKTSV